MSDFDRIRFLIDQCASLRDVAVGLQADAFVRETEHARVKNELESTISRLTSEVEALKAKLADAIKDRDPFLPELAGVNS